MRDRSEWTPDAEKRFALKITGLWKTLTPEQVAEFLLAVRRFWPQTAINALGEHFRDSEKFPTAAAIQARCRDKIEKAVADRGERNDARAQLIDKIERHKGLIVTSEAGSQFKIGAGGIYRIGDTIEGTDKRYEYLNEWEGAQPITIQTLKGILRQAEEIEQHEEEERKKSV